MTREEYYNEIEKFLAEEEVGEMLFPRELTAKLADSLAKLSLPPAEGAEEILRTYWFGIVDKRLDLPKTYDRVFKVTVAAMHEFASLHAQRLAEKMVEEKLKYNKVIQQRDELKEALAEMIWQFGYRSTYEGRESLHTGGLSALESAFGALGLSDPIALLDFEAAIKNTDG